MGSNLPSNSCSCREWRIKRKSERLLSGGVIGEKMDVIVMGIFRVVKEKETVEILGRGETKGMGRE